MKLSLEHPVEHATLHAATAVKHAGTEQTLSQAKVPGIKMTLIPQGLLCEVLSKKDKTPGFTLFPLAAVKSIYLQPQEEEAKRPPGRPAKE